MKIIETKVTIMEKEDIDLLKTALYALADFTSDLNAHTCRYNASRSIQDMFNELLTMQDRINYYIQTGDKPL